MEYNLCILYVSLSLLTSYIMYIRKHLNKMVVKLATQTKFYMDKGSTNKIVKSKRDCSTETIIDTQDNLTKMGD